ncbi:hypothetical protein [uncultured Desulfobacter sp.]|uniref:hypothetical protein n=1 Tax=uncultured Desulfobacter sp. TaxID=240139 RepID=UPI0029C95773|nr:hypothetical protein [uncultured Desulfobacter sp.]
MSYQGEVRLDPGESFEATGRRKIALCKSGTTAWSRSHSCNYPGPDMIVTVTIGGHMKMSGPFGGSRQWVDDPFAGGYHLKIENNHDKTSVMYAHVE